ncbi:hypothetical protein [Streptomyces sp. NPDC054786]
MIVLHLAAAVGHCCAVGFKLARGRQATTGPDLPPIPTGTEKEKAEAQDHNDARLQPGRSWHATLATRHTADLSAALASVLRDQLLPALTTKPKHLPRPEPKPKDEPKAKHPPANETRTTPKKEGTKR